MWGSVKMSVDVVVALSVFLALGMIAGWGAVHGIERGWGWIRAKAEETDARLAAESDAAFKAIVANIGAGQVTGCKYVPRRRRRWFTGW